MWIYLIPDNNAMVKRQNMNVLATEEKRILIEMR
jgi:hypothetical protein